MHLAHFRRHLKKLPAVKLNIRTAIGFLEQDLVPDLLQKTKTEIELEGKILDSYFMKVVNKSSKSTNLTLIES